MEVKDLMFKTLLQYAKGVVATLGTVVTYVLVNLPLADDGRAKAIISGVGTAVTIVGVILTKNADKLEEIADDLDDHDYLDALKTGSEIDWRATGGDTIPALDPNAEVVPAVATATVTPAVPVTVTNTSTAGQV